MKKKEAEQIAQSELLDKFCPFIKNMCVQNCIFFKSANVTFDDDAVETHSIDRVNAYGVRLPYCKLERLITKAIT